MSGDTFYFSHDYASRSDEKIKQLIRRHGMAGYGIFWAIVEDLYQNANALRTDCEGIAYDLRTDPEVVRSIIFDFGLFVHDDEKFGSESIERRMNMRNIKSVKASEAAFKRWKNANAMRPHTKDDANALRTECEGNAIKEMKVKESKGKETKERESKAAFAAPTLDDVTAFAEVELIGSKNAPQDFHDYYASNGWKVGGRAAMKDWRAAFRRWTRNEKTMQHDTNSKGPYRGLSARTRADWDALQEWGRDVEQGRVNFP